MSPSEAMGLFLRVWRQDWAGLSREQLARAVSLRAPGARITTEVIRNWERGQPPKDTPELEALLAVMGRHGIVQWELEDFRRAVFAGCIDQRYPELCVADNIAYRADVAELGEQLTFGSVEPGGVMTIVDLVATTAELEAWLRTHQPPGTTGAAIRDRQAALAFLRVALVNQHRWAGRIRLALATCTTNGEFVQTYFGPGGIRWLTPLLAQIAAESVVSELGHPAQACRRLLELSDAAVARGQLWVAEQGFGYAIAASSQSDPAYLYCGPQVRAFVKLADDWALAQRTELHYHLFNGALVAGALDAAQAHLNEWGQPPDVIYRRMEWLDMSGSLALARGDIRGAQVHFEQGLRLDETLWGEAARSNLSRFAGKLRACERALSPRARTVSLPPRAGDLR